MASLIHHERIWRLAGYNFFPSHPPRPAKMATLAGWQKVIEGC